MKLNDSAPMPLVAARWIVSRRLHATHSGGMRLLERLGHDVARRHLQPATVVAGEGRLDHHAGDGVECLVPLLALLLPHDVESAQLLLRRGLTRAEVDATVADQVERGNALSDSRGRVVAEGHGDDAVAQPDARCALAGGGEEHLRCGGVAVLLEEVVLDLPHVVDAQLVGELDLVERVLEQLVLGAVLPWARELVLVEDAELHAGPPLGQRFE